MEGTILPVRISHDSQADNLAPVMKEYTMLPFCIPTEEKSEGIEVLPADARRRIILDLSQVLLRASFRRRDLSPILFEALHCSLERLLFMDDQANLGFLEEWLDEEIHADEQLQPWAFRDALSPHDSSDDSFADLLGMIGNVPPADASVVQDRRFCERRFGERRMERTDTIYESQAASPVNESEAIGTYTGVERRRLKDRRRGPGRRLQQGIPEQVQDDESTPVIAGKSPLMERRALSRSTPGGATTDQQAPDNVALLRGAAVSAMLNSAMFRSQTAPLSNATFLRGNHNEPVPYATDTDSLEPGRDTE